jgi:glycosyltransferase involved in cell wall biosynthesis
VSVNSIHVELVTHNPPGTVSGIGRYVRELHRYLRPRLDVRIAPDLAPPLAARFSLLQHFPIGVQGHKAGAILHFTQIMGCAQRLWRPLHPAVATVHDLGVLVCPEDEILFDPVGRKVLDVQFAGLRRMDQYAVNSDRTRRDLVEKLRVPEDRIHFVQLGVELDTFRIIPDAQAQIAERYNLHPLEGGFDLIYVGSELPRKNFNLLLQAVAVLKARGYKLRLFKIGGAGGDQWRARTLAEIERLNLKEEIVFPGVVPEEDLPVFYNASDLAITPTLLEGGFAWLAMEAMGCGKPVVATEPAAIPQDARAAVMVVEARSLDALSTAIARLLDDSEARRSMGEAGARIIQHYTWEATAEAMIKVYEKVL